MQCSPRLYATIICNVVSLQCSLYDTIICYLCLV
jgi:hypothetical protein